MLTYFRLLLTWIAHSDRVGITAMRIAIAIVFLWIGALKFAPYEADSITPFVANSPVMSFFYKHPTDYKAHLTREGELNPADRAWQRRRGCRRLATPSTGFPTSRVQDGSCSRMSSCWPAHGL